MSHKFYTFLMPLEINTPFIAIQPYLKKQEKSQINNLTLHLKQLEKEEQKYPKVS